MKYIIEKLESFRSYRQKRIFLQSLGRVERGVGRMCVKIGKDKVLKVAYNVFGIQQNRKEISTWLDLTKHQRKYFATIYNYNPNNAWIIQERLLLPKRSNRYSLIKNKSYFYEKLCYKYELNFFEIQNQVGINKKGITKIYDYGYGKYD